MCSTGTLIDVYDEIIDFNNITCQNDMLCDGKNVTESIREFDVKSNISAEWTISQQPKKHRLRCPGSKHCKVQNKTLSPVFSDTNLHYAGDKGYNFGSLHFECYGGWKIPAFHHHFNNADYKNLSCEACTFTNILNTLVNDHQFDTNMHLLGYYSSQYARNYFIICKDSKDFLLEPYQDSEFFNHNVFRTILFFISRVVCELFAYNQLEDCIGGFVLQ